MEVMVEMIQPNLAVNQLEKLFRKNFEMEHKDRGVIKVMVSCLPWCSSPSSTEG